MDPFIGTGGQTRGVPFGTFVEREVPGGRHWQKLEMRDWLICRGPPADQPLPVLKIVQRSRYVEMEI